MRWPIIRCRAAAGQPPRPRVPQDGCIAEAPALPCVDELKLERNGLKRASPQALGEDQTPRSSLSRAPSDCHTAAKTKRHGDTQPWGAHHHYGGQPERVEGWPSGPSAQPRVHLDALAHSHVHAHAHAHGPSGACSTARSPARSAAAATAPKVRQHTE